MPTCAPIEAPPSAAPGPPTASRLQEALSASAGPQLAVQPLHLAASLLVLSRCRGHGRLQLLPGLPLGLQRPSAATGRLGGVADLLGDLIVGAAQRLDLRG